MVNDRPEPNGPGLPCKDGGYLLATMVWAPRREIAATSLSRRDLLSSFPVSSPAFQILERKYSSPYLVKMSLPSLGAGNVRTPLVRIITADFQSADLNRTRCVPASVSTVYSPDG